MSQMCGIKNSLTSLALLSFVVGTFISTPAFAQSQALETSLVSRAHPSPFSYKSRHFRDRLSSEQCGLFLEQLVQANAYKTNNSQLNTLLEAISVECGLSSKDPVIEFSPVLFQFEDSSLLILWDGSRIYINEKAEATYQYTLPSSFNNIVTITKDQTQGVGGESNGSKILDYVAQKIGEIKDRLVTVERDGKTFVILSGYAWHDRNTYTREKINELNEKAYGIGFEKVIINENGNREGVSLMVISDSHSDPQFTAGYEWQAGLRVSRNIKLWGGFTAGLAVRSDFNYIPIPFALPTAGISIGKLNIKSVIIPKIGGAVNSGAVIFLFASIPIEYVEFKRQ